LNELSKLEAERDEIIATIDELAPGARESLTAEKMALLTDDERAALEVPYEMRNATQHMAAQAPSQRVIVTHREVAARANDENRQRATDLAKRLLELEEVYIAHTVRYRNQVNFGYWLMRCELEQTKDAIAARKHLYDADRYLDDVNPDAARKEFELAWDRWADLFDRFPGMVNDETMSNLAGPMKKYMEVLSQLDLKPPEKFKLQTIWERHMKATNIPNQPLDPSLPSKLLDAADPSRK